MSGLLNLSATYKRPSRTLVYPEGAVVVLSLREVPGYGWTGALVRVRRSSDNAEADFYQGATAGSLSMTHGSNEISLLNFVNANNLILRSEEFDNSSWNKLVGTVTANAAVAPDGTTTADQLTHGTAINVYQVPTTSNGVDYIFSCYLKKSGSVNNCDIYMYQLSTGFISQATFNLDNGTIVSQTYGTGATITSVGSGWYRCTVHGTTIGATNTSFGVYNSTEVYAWGAQINTPTLTDYIKTTGSTVTGTYDGYIKTWYDQSGNTNNYTQSSGIYQPKIVSGGSLLTLNSKVAIHSGGGSVRLEGPSFSTTSSTILAVASMDSGYTPTYDVETIFNLTNSANFIWTNHLFYVESTSKFYEGYADASNFDSALNSSAVSKNTQYVIAGNIKSSTMIVSANNIDSNTTTKTATPSGINNSSLFNSNVSSSWGYYPMVGNIQEIIFYQTDKSSDEGFIKSIANSYYKSY